MNEILSWIIEWVLIFFFWLVLFPLMVGSCAMSLFCILSGLMEVASWVL